MYELCGGYLVGVVGVESGQRAMPGEFLDGIGCVDECFYYEK